MGGHSLLATQVAARLQQGFGVEVPLRHVLGIPTVAGLAEAMEADPATGARVRRVAELLAELADAKHEEPRPFSR